MPLGKDPQTPMLPWPDLLRTALALGVQPDAFWRLSLTEWRALNGAQRPLTRTDLAALIAAHPDERTLHDQP